MKETSCGCRKPEERNNPCDILSFHPSDRPDLNLFCFLHRRWQSISNPPLEDRIFQKRVMSRCTAWVRVGALVLVSSFWPRKENYAAAMWRQSRQYNGSNNTKMKRNYQCPFCSRLQKHGLQYNWASFLVLFNMRNAPSHHTRQQCLDKSSHKGR